MTTATQDPDVYDDAPDPADAGPPDPTPTTGHPDGQSANQSTGQPGKGGEVEEVHHTLTRTLTAAAILGTGVTIAVLGHFIGAAALVAGPVLGGGAVIAGVYTRRARRNRSQNRRRGGGGLTAATRGAARRRAGLLGGRGAGGAGRRGAASRGSNLGRALLGRGGKPLGGGRQAGAGKAGGLGGRKPATANRSIGLGGRARKPGASRSAGAGGRGAGRGIGGRGSAARRSPIGRAARGGIFGGLLGGNRAARRAAASGGGRGGHGPIGRAARRAARRANTAARVQRRVQRRAAYQGKSRGQRLAGDVAGSWLGGVWYSAPVRWARWAALGVGYTAIGLGYTSLYGVRASRRLLTAVRRPLAASRPVLSVRHHTRRAVALAGGFLRRQLRRAVAWSRMIQGNAMAGWVRRAVAGTLRAVLLLWLFDRISRWWRKRHPQPVAQPPQPMNPPPLPAQPATRTVPPPPPVNSPRFPSPRRSTPVTVLPMHQAVAELIDTTQAISMDMFSNLADCRLFVASLPALMDHAAAAMLQAREFVMDHTPTAATFQQAWGDFITQFNALGSASPDVQAQMEAWTGSAELPPVLHPSILTVCSAWDALGAVQHADLEEARMLCGSLHTVFRYSAMAIENAVGNIMMHSPTAAGFAAEAEQFQMAMASMEDEAQSALQHLEIWTEEPEVTA